MRKNLCAFALIAAAILPSAVRAETSVSHFKGVSAFAEFTTSDSTNCIISEVSVSAYEFLFQFPAQGSSTDSLATLDIYQYDSCQQIFLRDLSGYINLPEGAFDARGKLRTVRLVTSLDLHDQNTNATIPASIDLTWTGVGDVSRASSNYRVSYPQYRMSSHGIGNSRAATMAGAVVLEGVNLVPDSSAWARIDENQSGSLYKSR